MADSKHRSQARLIDISPILSERIAVWPGDQSFSRKVALSIELGDNIALSSIESTVHLGAHADAPSHYIAAGQDIASRPLGSYFGRCQVIGVDLQRGQRIKPQHIQTKIDAPRILFRSGSFPDPESWNEDFCALSPELIDHLADAGVQLVGIDTPSIDLAKDQKLLSHSRVAAHDIAVLEGLVLDHVADGFYTLIALPLKIEGADAAPLRAALLDDGGSLA